MRRLEGFYVQFASHLDVRHNERLHALHGSLRTDLPEGVTDLTPGYVNLYVEFDANVTTSADVRAWIARHLNAPQGEQSSPGRLVDIPVRYDGEDLADVARRTGLSENDVIHLHSRDPYRVFAVGFTPGFPFLGELPEVLRLPRRDSPRAQVPFNAVAIANAQSCIYVLPSPGGWNLIGTALTTVYDPNRDEPFLLAPGDSVRFVPAVGQSPPLPDVRTVWPESPARPALLVDRPGLLDLLVDGGRFRQAHQGMARGGPMDERAANRANGLVANPTGTPLLELTTLGPRLTALRDVILGVAGFGLHPNVDGRRVPLQTSFLLRKGETLSFTPTSRGARAYLAVAGGLETRPFLGSSSVDRLGRVGRALMAGDVLGVTREARARPGFSNLPLDLPETTTLRLLPGPQASREALEALTSGPFSVGTQDRMGVQLSGPNVPGGQVISEGTPQGAVQVTPAGHPILLLNDRGRIGGYHKPAVLHPADLLLAAQLRTGERVRFRVSDAGSPEDWARRWFMPA